MTDIKDTTKWEGESDTNPPTYSIPTDSVEYNSHVYKRASVAIL